MADKVFRLQNGKEYMFPEHSCAFCEHCTDVFYDYTNGPYSFRCDSQNKMGIDSVPTDCKEFVLASEHQTRTTSLSEYYKQYMTKAMKEEFRKWLEKHKDRYSSEKLEEINSLIDRLYYGDNGFSLKEMIQ